MSNRITAQNINEVRRRFDGPTKRRILTELGRPYLCVLCDNDGMWLGQPLTLQVDHIDGDGTNNDPSNMRYLCPNCHVQTQTHSFKGRKHSEKAKRKMSLKAKKSRPRQRTNVIVVELADTPGREPGACNGHEGSTPSDDTATN